MRFYDIIIIRKNQINSYIIYYDEDIEQLLIFSLKAFYLINNTNKQAYRKELKIVATFSFLCNFFTWVVYCKGPVLIVS